MKKRYGNYSLSFKQKAVELSIARGNVKQVCDELDIPYSVLHRWGKESESYGKNRFPGRGKPKLTDDQKEIAELSVFTWIETWYNKRRRHSSLGYKTINEFNLKMYNQNLAT